MGISNTRNSKKVTYDGITYESLLSLSNSLGISYSIILHAIQRGMPETQAISESIKLTSKHELVVWGQRFESILPLCEYYGISPYLFFKYSEENLSTEEVIGLCHSSTLEYDGKVYSSLSDLCASMEIQYSTVYSRLRNGWSLERSLTEPLNSRGRRTKLLYSYRGMDYPSKSSLCVAYGISANLVTSVSKALGSYGDDWMNSFDLLVEFFEGLEGLRPPVIPKIPYVIYNGEWYFSSADFCKSCCVSLHDYRRAQFAEKGGTPFSWMSRLRNGKCNRYEFDGKYLTNTQVVQETGVTCAAAVRQGIVKKVTVPYCDECTFSVKSYSRDDIHGLFNERIIKRALS